MSLREFVKEGEILVTPDNLKLQYCGRIGVNAEKEREMTFPGSFVRWSFKGTGTAVVLSWKRFYWNAYAGCIIDGQQLSFELPGDEGTVRLELGHDLDDCEHSVMFFKRQDACNIFTIKGIVLDEGSELCECPQRPVRRIEVYGDSVSAGEVSEAVDYVAKPDPEGHNGQYSNCWYSYSWMTARKLNAELHDIAQGGVALLDGTGWFAGPDYVGLESIYDKVKYYPDSANATKWNFNDYTPHVVVVAIGQNDANPEDFMKSDYNGEKAENWRKHYRAFLLRLRALYPKALIVCATTILGHDASWDRAIGEVTEALRDMKIVHFMYTANGCGTPGHIRIPEAEKMSGELAGFIEGFGASVWED